MKRSQAIEKALREVEWNGAMYFDGLRCPACGGEKPDHSNGCVVANALKPIDNASQSRASVISYFDARKDHSREERDSIISKIEAASDKSIITEPTCMGKHWWYMDFDDRNTCPYCGWQLTRR